MLHMSKMHKEQYNYWPLSTRFDRILYMFINITIKSYNVYTLMICINFYLYKQTRYNNPDMVKFEKVQKLITIVEVGITKKLHIIKWEQKLRKYDLWANKL